jgi:hypothetical protein
MAVIPGEQVGGGGNGGHAEAMTSDVPADKKPAPKKIPEPPPYAMRHIYGPRPLAALVPTLVRPAFRRRAPATAHVLADWPLIVGPAIAAVTTPRKLFGGTLAIGCTGPMALELQHLSAELISRINTHAGSVIVSRLRFVQEGAPPVAPLPPVRPQAVAEAREAVAGLPEGDLRDALERLGRVVLGRKPG